MTEVKPQAIKNSRRRLHPETFWLVWSPQGGPPTAKMETFVAARGVARSLAAKCPSQDFFVLESCWRRLAGSGDGEKTEELPG